MCAPLRSRSRRRTGRTGNGTSWVGAARSRCGCRPKRLQRNGVLKVRHKVKSSGSQQRDLLIGGARADRMKAVYCIYCTEPQRNIWQQPTALPGLGSFQTGCLLADAAHVPLTTRKLGRD